MAQEEESNKHESYGQIIFSRVNGQANFYGSELQQQNYISMEVHHSEVHKSLSSERYHTTGSAILRLRMSCGQFSELITSMNQGSGVPCTLERINGSPVAELPTQESRKELVHRMFHERMVLFASKMKERQSKAKELVKKKSLSKDDIHELTQHLEWLTTEITSNIPFFAEQFQESMDKVVHEAKLEVENAIQHKITTLGLNALHAENKLLGNS